MRTSAVWGWLSMVGLVGVSVAAGCSGSSNPSVGEYNGGVEGQSCSPVGQTSNSSDGCNTCTCGSDNKLACTKKACGGGSGGSNGTGGGTTCKEGDKMAAADGCNTCTCTPSGDWACTLLGCVACIPGMTKPATDGCNTCTCSGTGDWACTEKACAPACKPGDTKMEACNTCTCSDTGEWGCTKKACVGECTQGQTMMIDCNTCGCTAGGQWVCTQKACAPATCPAPVPSGGACDTVIVWAKDPVGGQCCMYGTPCTSPAGWKTFTQESECQKAAQ
jgi:Pacifastin inhibitor (LCMII)